MLVVCPAILVVLAFIAWLSIRPIDRLSSWISKRFKDNGQSDEIKISQFRRGHLLEIVLIVIIALFVTRNHLNLDPNLRLHGRETEWLTGYGQVAHEGLKDTGVIPLWNPYYGQGEPLVDNAFSYLLNPFSSIPQLMWGATQGTKISVVIQCMLVAIGGWFLAKVLGLSTVGRLTLALLMLGKGNLHTNFDSGFFQLASQQVYFPWVIAGTIAVIKTSKRWAIVLMSFSLTLMFFAGNLWHLLPTAISVTIVTLLYARSDKHWDYAVLRRMGIVALITIGLSAVTLLSIVANFGFTEGHKDERRSGWEVIDAHRVYLYPFVGDYDFVIEDVFIRRPPELAHDDDLVTLMSWGIGSHFYYSYVAPWWYVLSLLLLLIFLPRYRSRLPDNRKLWIAGFGLYVLFTMWGMGGTPLFNFLYEYVPYLAQWRFVPRALGMASFWIAVLVALGIDALLSQLWSSWRFNYAIAQRGISARLPMGLLILYSGLTVIALVDVNGHWQDTPLAPLDEEFDSCMAWLEEAEPDREHWLWIPGYQTLTTMLEHDIRIVNIEADFVLGTEPNTIGDVRLDVRVRAVERGVLSFTNVLDWFNDEGYTALEPSPSYQVFDHCIYENKNNSLPYAFVIQPDDAPSTYISDLENPELTTEFMNNLYVETVPDVMRLYDTIAIQVRSDESIEKVLTIQELAFPGWEVWIDGEQRDVEIFAKLNAVRLPTDGQRHEVVFLYRPRLVCWGGLITLFTAMLCIGFLLHIDHVFWRRQNNSAEYLSELI